MSGQRLWVAIQCLSRVDGWPFCHVQSQHTFALVLYTLMWRVTPPLCCAGAHRAGHCSMARGHHECSLDMVARRPLWKAGLNDRRRFHTFDGVLAFHVRSRHTIQLVTHSSSTWHATPESRLLCGVQGHIALDTAVWPEGTTGFSLDTLARLPLWKAGLDYRHGTGHGVGAALNVHEGPQVCLTHLLGVPIGCPLWPWQAPCAAACCACAWQEVILLLVRTQ